MTIMVKKKKKKKKERKKKKEKSLYCHVAGVIMFMMIVRDHSYKVPFSFSNTCYIHGIEPTT